MDARSYPAVYNATEPHPHTSKRYRFLPTATLLDALKPQGFEVAAMSQGLSRSPYARHTVTLTHPLMPFVEVVPGDRVQFRVVMLNSHDASKRLVLHAGAFRSFCFNGMVFGALRSESIKITHNQTAPALDNFIEGVFRIVDETKEHCATMQRMARTPLPIERQLELAQRAITLRWPNAAPVTPADLILPRRAQDIHDTVFHVYQRVQENLVKGGQPGRTQSNRLHTTREVRSAVNGVRINTQLWELAKEYTA